jgi:hypothetical protein
MRYADLGHGLERAPRGPFLSFPPVDAPVPDIRPIGGFGPVQLHPWRGPFPPVPLHVARWRWTGYPDLFDALDANDDEAVDEDELARGIGRGLHLLRGEAAGPIDEEDWQGDPEAFRLVDADGDGRVSHRELAQALGPHAIRLAHGHPAHGPMLPAGSEQAFTAHARWVVFKNREDKAQYMRRAAIHDAQDPQVKSWAVEFLKLPEDKRATAILRFVQECVRYERDPATFDPDGTRHGIELLDSAPTGLCRGYGDCDLKARLFVALCLASGIPAQIDPVFRGETGFPHVRARVLRIGGETSDPRNWDVADPTIVNSDIGKLPAKPLTAWPEHAGEARRDTGPE